MKFSEGLEMARQAVAEENAAAMSDQNICRSRLQQIADQIDVEGYEYAIGFDGGPNIRVWKTGSGGALPIWYSAEHGYSYRFFSSGLLTRTKDVDKVVEDLCYALEKYGSMKMQK